MSMVSDLLFGVMPDLPVGKPRKNLCVTGAVKAFRKLQRTTQEKNLEAVYRAIAEGHCTNATIRGATGLVKSTVFNACRMLLEADRITVNLAHRPHAFHVKEK